MFVSSTPSLLPSPICTFHISSANKPCFSYLWPCVLCTTNHYKLGLLFILFLEDQIVHSCVIHSRKLAWSIRSAWRFLRICVATFSYFGAEIFKRITATQMHHLALQPFETQRVQRNRVGFTLPNDVIPFNDSLKGHSFPVLLALKGRTLKFLDKVVFRKKMYLYCPLSLNQSCHYLCKRAEHVL